jgi:hypothetical protein
VIHHIARATMKATASPEQIEAAVEGWREQGRTIPAVTSYFLGRDHGDFEHTAIFVVEDLDGVFEYLTHPATYATDHLGLDLVERLEIFDVSDSDDPDLEAKIRELHRRRNALNPQIAEMLVEVPAFRGDGVDD